MFVFDVLYFILKIIVFVLIIYGVQYGWDTIKNTYTKPKTKDLVNSQLKKYKEMFGDVYKETIPDATPLPEVLFKTDDDKQQMNEELLEFVNSQTNSLS
jgi:hypothetical protein